jgi:hypothetical protein
LFFFISLALKMVDDRRKAMYDGFDSVNFSHSREWGEVAKDFVSRAFANNPSTVKCPCSICRNCWRQNLHNLQLHLLKNGFMPNYLVWYELGEVEDPVPDAAVVDEEEDVDRMDEMLADLRNEYLEGESLEPPEEIQQFYKLLEAVERKVHEGTHVTVLEAVTRLMAMKSKYNISNNCFNDFLKFVMDLIPQNHELPKDLYHCKKVVAGLGMDYKKIDACENNCMLFWNRGEGLVNDEGLTHCKVCKKSRYIEVVDEDGCSVTTNVPIKQLRYMPIGPRLKRLFLNPEVAEQMRWHKVRDRSEQDPDIMIHPSDGEAWEALDSFDPGFASDPRSVRLGMSTDGFTPYSTSSTSYSCWPVFMMPYNLPPTKCMKEGFMFLALIIPGPKHPGTKINVFMEALMKELEDLWKGQDAYDAFSKRPFKLRAAYLWSIHDLPAYGIWSGWCTHGKLMCPICKSDTKAYRLDHGKKVTFFDSHRRFLPRNHPFRNDTKSFRKGIKVTEGPPKRLTGKDIIHQLEDLKLAADGVSFEGYGKQHNWSHKSFLWNLPYAEALILPHNVDLMHQERNVAESIISMCFDFTGQTKDNLNARKDLAMLCDRPFLEVQRSANGNESRPRAPYCLKPEDRKKILRWVKSLKFPDRYAANLKRAVNLGTGKLNGLKSHDYHILMERLLPVMFRGFLSHDLWKMLAELSYFYRQLCAKEISKKLMLKFEKEVVVLLCKMEKVFPPGFMNCMQHLMVHLPWEAHVGGPVQFRWMYSQERELKKLRATVRNKARVEGCIAEAFAAKEITNFSNLYLSSANNVNAHSTRYHIVNEAPLSDLSVFQWKGIGVGASTAHNVELPERNRIMLYMYCNMPELTPFFNMFEEAYKPRGQQLTQKQWDDILVKGGSGGNSFITWFHEHVIIFLES